MKRDQYIPHDVSARNNSKIMRLIEEEGAAGYGIYWALVEYLRTQENYAGSMKLLKIIARQMHVTLGKVKKVLLNYELFSIENDTFISTGLCTRMKRLDAKRLQFEVYKRRKEESNALIASSDKATVKNTIVPQTVQVPVAQTEPLPSTASSEASSVTPVWERWVDELDHESQWKELMAKKSELWMQFFPLFPHIVACFKEHVLGMGNEDTIRCLNDAKHYFSCYITPGSVTHKRLMETLLTAAKEESSSDPYRYEQRDAHTGIRSYYGVPIPADAPPRPNERALWNPEGGGWE